jgi:hypothetical protein
LAYFLPTNNIDHPINYSTDVGHHESPIFKSGCRRAFPWLTRWGLPAYLAHMWTPLWVKTHIMQAAVIVVAALLFLLARWLWGMV